MVRSIIVFVGFFLVCSCQTVVQDEAVQMVEVNGRRIPVIWPEKITREKPFKLMDWFQDFELIELETTDLSMIKYVFRQYVGEDYIIISSNECGIIHYD